MRIQAQVRSIEYFNIEVEVPDDADYFEQREAIVAAYGERTTDPDDHDIEVGDIDPITEDEQ